MFRRKPKEPGAWEKEQARLCRVAAQLAIQEGDPKHADTLESSALEYEKIVLCAVRSDRESRAGATLFSYEW